MKSNTITFDQLPHVVGDLSEKLDQVLELLEKVGIANPVNHHKPIRRIVYAKEACTIIGKSLSSLYRGVKSLCQNLTQALFSISLLYEMSDFEYDFPLKY